MNSGLLKRLSVIILAVLVLLSSISFSSITPVKAEDENATITESVTAEQDDLAEQETSSQEKSNVISEPEAFSETPYPGENYEEEEQVEEVAPQGEAKEEIAVDVSKHPLAEVEASEDEPLLDNEELNQTTLSMLQNGLPGMRLKAAPSPQEEVSQDGVSIEKITIKWLSKSTGSDEPAEYDTLIRETDNATVGNQQFQIDFAIAGKDDHEPGTIELVFPAYLWLDRYGNEPGKLTLSVPEDPETGADFAWKRVGDNIVITNTRKMSAASKVMLQCTFRDVKPYNMVDIDVADSSKYANADYPGVSRADFSATINLTTPAGNVISMTSNTIDATINTKVEAASATKSALNTNTKEYYVYHTVAKAQEAGIPQEFIESLGEDVAKYSFVRWYVSGSATGSQPFDMTVTDEYDPSVTVFLDPRHQQTEEIDVAGKMLGVQGDKDGKNILSEDGKSVTATLFSGYDTYPKSAYVWTAYDHTDPKLKEGVEYEIHNSQTVSVTGWDDQKTSTKTAEAKAPFNIPIIYTVKKVWDDNNNEAKRRYDSQGFTISYTDANGYYHSTYPSVNETGNWSYSWSDEGMNRKYNVSESHYGTHYYNIEYDENNAVLSYDAWWYEQTGSAYDAETHTWTFTNKYRDEHYERGITKLVPRYYSYVDKYTRNYTWSQRMDTHDRALNELRRGDNVTIPYHVSGYSEIMAHTYGGGDLDTTDPTSYGRKKVTVELEDNYASDTPGEAKNNRLRLDDIQLSIDDAEIAWVDMNNPAFGQYYMIDDTTAQNFNPSRFGGWDYKTVNPANAPVEVLLGYVVPSGGDEGDGEWVEYATLSGGTVTGMNGAKASGRRVYLPKNVLKVKTRIEVPATDGSAAQRIDRVSMNYDIGIMLKANSATIKQRLEKIFEQNDYGLSTLDNYVIINTYDSNGNIIPPKDARGNYFSGYFDYSKAYLHGRNYKVAVRSEKDFEITNNDVTKRELTLHSKITMTQQSNVLERNEYDASVKEGLIPNSEEGIWYDLLPLSVLPDTDTIKLTNGDELQDVHVVNNYKQTGRVLLVVKATLKDNVSYTKSTDPNPYASDITYPSEGFKNVHTLEFDSYYSWDQARIYGLDNCRNVAAFETTSENELGNIPGWSGEPDDPQRNNNQRAMDAVGDDKEIMTGLHRERTEEHKAFTYAGDILHHEELDFMATTELKKFVTKDGLGVWTSGQNGQQQVEVYEGGYYSYMLFVAAGSETVTSNIILLDALDSYVPTPDNKETIYKGNWKGSFVSVDTSELEAQYDVKPVIWYYVGNASPGISPAELQLELDKGSESSQGQYKINDKDAIIHYLETTEGWTTTLPEDPSTVKAIAVDARYKKDGKTPFELGKEKDFYVTVRMKAPVYETTGQSGDPFDADEIKRQDSINNDHAFNNVYLNCTQVDTVQRETNAYIFYNYTRVGILPFELKVTKGWDDKNNNDGLRPDSIIVHLLANGKRLNPDRTLTLNEDNKWTGVFDHILQYDDEGNWITYSFEEESGETGDGALSLKPYTMTFSRENNDVKIRNTHVPETTEISFTKTWKGDEDEDNIIYRPDYIVVRLNADGVYTGKSVVVKPDRMGVWAGNFTGLPKYSNPSGNSGDQHEIRYTVEEEPVYKYTPNYEEKISDGDKSVAITNTFYPYGDLKVSKEVINATEISKE